jgi:hypothetical protein
MAQLQNDCDSGLEVVEAKDRRIKIRAAPKSSAVSLRPVHLSLRHPPYYCINIRASNEIIMTRFSFIPAASPFEALECHVCKKKMRSMKKCSACGWIVCGNCREYNVTYSHKEGGGFYYDGNLRLWTILE